MCVCVCLASVTKYSLPQHRRPFRASVVTWMKSSWEQECEVCAREVANQVCRDVMSKNVIFATQTIVCIRLAMFSVCRFCVGASQQNNCSCGKWENSWHNSHQETNHSCCWLTKSFYLRFLAFPFVFLATLADGYRINCNPFGNPPTCLPAPSSGRNLN